MIVTKKMVEVGDDIASHLMDAGITYQMRPDKFNIEVFPEEYRDLVQKYVTGEMESVEAIYTAMHRAREL